MKRAQEGENGCPCVGARKTQTRESNINKTQDVSRSRRDKKFGLFQQTVPRKKKVTGCSNC
jgi:hypothetical protein